MHPVLLIALYWWSLDHSTVVVSEVHRIHQLWTFPLWWREISHTGTRNSLLPCPVPLKIASSSQVWYAVAGEELPLVSPMVHTWYSSHQPKTQFIWTSLVSPNGLFLDGCPTNKESRDTSCVLIVVLEACTKSSNLHKFSSYTLNTLTSQALVSCCHRMLSFEPSDLWE